MSGRKPNGNYEETILNKVTDHYPHGVRYTDIENAVSPEGRPNIHAIINKLLKEKKITREKACKNCKETYYRLVIKNGNKTKI